MLWPVRWENGHETWAGCQRHVWAQHMDSKKANLNQEVVNARDVTALHDGMLIAVTIQMPPDKYGLVLNVQSVQRFGYKKWPAVGQARPT